MHQIVAVYSSEAIASPYAAHPPSTATSKPSSFLVPTAAAASSPEGDAVLPMVARCKTAPAPRPSLRFCPLYHFPVYSPSSEWRYALGQALLLLPSNFRYLPLSQLWVNSSALYPVWVSFPTLYC